MSKAVLHSVDAPSAASESGEHGGSDEVFADLRDAIRAGRFRDGDRIPSLRSLAEHYGVGINTVRHAVRRLEEDLGLVERRHGAGTYVCPRFTDRPSPTHRGTGTTQNVNAVSSNLVVTMLATHDRLYYTFAGLLNDLLGEAGCRVLNFGTGTRHGVDSMVPVIEAWRDAPPRAVVLQASYSHLKPLIHHICGERTRIIEVFSTPPTGGPADRLPSLSHQVTFDMRMVYSLVIDHLVDQGHRRIGFVTYTRRRFPDQRVARMRSIASGKALQLLGRHLRERGIQRGLTVLHNQRDATASNAALTPANIERAKQWLSQPDPPTAVVGDDHRVAGVIRAAEQLGLRVPQDLAVIGQGCTEWSESMNFTSVDYQLPEIARHVAELVARDPAQASGSRYQILVPPRLIERCPNAASSPGLH